MLAKAEIRGVLAVREGLSCDGYFGIADATAHLRAGLYVSVVDGDKLFLPKYPFEHFPVAEIADYYLERVRYGLNESIGAHGSEVLFVCEGPAADAGATAIERALIGLEALMVQSRFNRAAAVVPQKVRYGLLERSGTLAYRPPQLPARAGVPQPLTEHERRTRERGPATLAEAFRQLARPHPEITERIEARKREILRGWGLEETYARMQAERSWRGRGWR